MCNVNGGDSQPHSRLPAHTLAQVTPHVLTMTATVLSPGFLTTVQDEGRSGFRDTGVSAGGALDAHALRVANLLVGNESSAAALEITLGGFRLRFENDRVIALCGGAFDVRIGDLELPAGRPALARAGEELVFDRSELGCRAWLAISGGVDVPVVLGSRSTDLRSNFGGLHGRALRAGDAIPLGGNERRSRSLITMLETQRVAQWFAPAAWATTTSPTPILRVIRGGEWLRFEPEVRRLLRHEVFTVTPEADRMGIRLEGPPLQYGGPELLSEAVSAGTIQVPLSGQPIILLPDCQTIGGYPKLAHVITVDLPLAAQLRAGDQVRFELVRLAEAHALLLERNRELALFRAALALRTR